MLPEPEAPPLPSLPFAQIHQASRLFTNEEVEQSNCLKLFVVGQKVCTPYKTCTKASPLIMLPLLMMTILLLAREAKSCTLLPLALLFKLVFIHLFGWSLNFGLIFRFKIPHFSFFSKLKNRDFYQT